MNDIPKGIRETRGDEVIYHAIGCRKDLSSDGVQGAFAVLRWPQRTGVQLSACRKQVAENVGPSREEAFLVQAGPRKGPRA